VGSKVFQAFKNLRLASKFTLAVVFIMAVVVVALTTLIISYQRSSLKAEVDRNHRSLARNLAKDVVGPLIFLDPLRLDELVRAIDQIPGCVSAAVVDRGRRVVAHTDRKRLGEVLPSPPPVARAGETQERTDEVAGVREIIVPVVVGYEAIGTVMVGFSQDEREGLIEEDLKGLKRYIFAISTLILGLGLAGAFFLARLLTTPIKRLTDTMELVQEGDLSVQIELGDGGKCRDILVCEEADCPAYRGGKCWTMPGTRCFGHIQGDTASKFATCRQCLVFRSLCGDEIGELTAAFNEMVRRLSENMRRLEETTKEKARLERVTALGEMSMTVAHEVKNPLNAIRGAVSYLHKSLQDDSLKEFLEIIEEETQRLNEIVTSFLRFSKPPPLRLHAADVNHVVKDTLRLVRQEATENGVELVLSLDERAPPILLDAQQFRQALLNVLVNALDATKQGDTVSIRTGVVDSRIRILIADTGAGIEEEVVKDIFRPFFTTKTRGSGLGLACVERIVREHGGGIAVKSEVGKGTEFEITLPLERGNG
jgi:two-component system sensor histidine kinase HydH